jgi:hypothetical protein
MKNKNKNKNEVIATPDTQTLQQRAAFTMLIAGGVMLAVGVFIQLITSGNKKLIETTNPYDPSISLEDGIERLRVLAFALEIHPILLNVTKYQIYPIVSGATCITAGIAPRFFNTKKQDQPSEQVAGRRSCELLQTIDKKEEQATSSNELVELKQEKKEKLPELDQILAGLFQIVSKTLHKEQQTVTERLLLDFYNRMDRLYQDYLRTDNYTEFALDCRCLATSVQLSKLAKQVPITYGIDSEIVFYLCNVKKPYYYEFDNNIKPLVDFCRNLPLRQIAFGVNPLFMP